MQKKPERGLLVIHQVSKSSRDRHFRAHPPAIPESSAPGIDHEPTVCLWASPLLHVGEFIAATSHPLFRDSGPIKGVNVVFPRTTLQITWADGVRRCSDPATINYFNEGERIERSTRGADGDQCVWIEPQPALLTTLADLLRPGPGGLERAPFRLGQAPSEPRLFLRAMLLAKSLHQPNRPDELTVEEEALHILRGAIGLQIGYASTQNLDAGARTTEWTEAGREVLNAHFREPLSLGELAAKVGCSPFHLAHAFRAVTGTSLHQYRLRLRLARAAEHLFDGAGDLTQLALDLGFSSHSHFTSTFRRHTGVTPSNLRLAARGPLPPGSTPSRGAPSPFRGTRHSTSLLESKL